MVATAVADRARDRIAQLIYLDAFVPRSGQSLTDLLPPDARDDMRARVQTGDGGRLPPNPSPPDTSEADLRWIAERRLAQSFKCFEQPVRLSADDVALPRSYIYCTRIGHVDVFRPFAERARSEPGWRHFEIDASHSAQITAPETLMAVLEAIVGGNA
jgi:hypothetical protein